MSAHHTTSDQLEQRARMILSDRRSHSEQTIHWAWTQVKDAMEHPLGLDRRPFTDRELSLGAKW